MRWFKPEEVRDLVLFSPNGAALRRTNTSVLHPPSWPHVPDRPCYVRLCEQGESTSHFLCHYICVCLWICAHLGATKYVFLKFGTLLIFPPPGRQRIESPHIPALFLSGCISAVWHIPAYLKFCAATTLGLDTVCLCGFWDPKNLRQPLYWLSHVTQKCCVLFSFLCF